MSDNLSIERIKRMSALAIRMLEKPCVLMIGPPTAAQMRTGRHQRNWRMSVFHKNEWWHCGGHIEAGVATRWHDWSPPGRWNVLGFKPETADKIQKVIELAQMEGLVPMFVKPEREPDEFNRLLQWALDEWRLMYDRNDETAGALPAGANQASAG